MGRGDRRTRPGPGSVTLARTPSGSAPTVDGLRDDVAAAADAGFTSYWTPQIFDLDALTALAVISREVPDGSRFGSSAERAATRSALAELIG
ncbi:MAG: hypothetical protein ACR2JF_00355 [Iamia sp.]